MNGNALKPTEDLGSKSQVPTTSEPAAVVRNGLLGLTDLKPAPYNPRRISPEALAALRRSLVEFGDLSGFTKNLRTGNLIAAHQRLEALRQQYGDALRLEGDEIVTPDGNRFRVRVVDWDEAKERAANVTANSPLLAGVFTEGLGPILDQIEHDLPELAEALRLDELRDLVPEPEFPDLEEEAEVPEPPAEPTTRKGDLVILGEHRLLVDDATVEASWQRLMAGTMADIFWSDFPYGVAYVGKTGDAMTIQNDDLGPEAFKAFILAILSHAYAHSRPGASIYLFHADTRGEEFRAAFREAGWELHQVLQWVKDAFVLGRQDYHWRHEPILFGWKPGAAHLFRGGRDQDTVWECPRPKANSAHPTIKPRILATKAFQNSSRPGAIVVDSCLGAGTALLACQDTQRRCFAMEIEPKYADCAIQMWVEATGKKALIERDGQVLEWTKAKPAGPQGPGTPSEGCPT